MSRTAAISRLTILLVGIWSGGIHDALASPDPKPDRRVKVFCYVEEDPSGFVDQRVQELRDSLKDLKQAVSKKKDWLELVEGREQADIVVQVVDRRLEPSGRFEGSATAVTDKRGRTTTGTASSREIMIHVVHAVMTVGDYKNELIGRIQDTYLLGGLWRTAAGDVADQLEKWVKTNYTKLELSKAKTSR